MNTFRKRLSKLETICGKRRSPWDEVRDALVLAAEFRALGIAWHLGPRGIDLPEIQCLLDQHAPGYAVVCNGLRVLIVRAGVSKTPAQDTGHKPPPAA